MLTVKKTIYLCLLIILGNHVDVIQAANEFRKREHVLTVQNVAGVLIKPTQKERGKKRAKAILAGQRHEITSPFAMPDLCRTSRVAFFFRPKEFNA